MKKILQNFFLKKEIFDELTNEGMLEIQELSKQIDFGNWIYYFKDEN